MGSKGLKILLILVIAVIISTGCDYNLNLKDPSTLIDTFIEKLSDKENIVFYSKTTIHREDQMAVVNLKGVQFIETSQIYYIGDASGHRIELFQDSDKIYIKNSENQWTSLEAGGATEIGIFLNNPLRLLEYSKHSDLQLLDNKTRLNRRNYMILSGPFNKTGVNKYIANFLPELLETYEEIFIENSLYIDVNNKTLGRIDIFVTELSGEFSLVTELTISDYDVNTEIMPPK